MMNCNPETVSTDYDTSSRLYFEPLTVEDVLNVIEEERPDGIIVQFGGQTPLKLAGDLQAALTKFQIPAASGRLAPLQVLSFSYRDCTGCNCLQIRFLPLWCLDSRCSRHDKSRRLFSANASQTAITSFQQHARLRRGLDRVVV